MDMNPESQKPIDKVTEFVALLKEAVKYGFEISFDENSYFDFSPVDILLDSMIDILLIMRKLFDLGSTGPRKNQGIGFSDRFQDVLGNPKQFRINFARDYFWDPEAYEFLMQLASVFISVKRHKTFRKAFMAFVEVMSLTSGSTEPKKKRRSKANYHYQRRQSSRKRRLIRNK